MPGNESRNPLSIALRPLGGMDLETPATQLKLGTMTEVYNAVVRQRGIELCPGVADAYTGYHWPNKMTIDSSYAYVGTEPSPVVARFDVGHLGKSAQHALLTSAFLFHTTSGVTESHVYWVRKYTKISATATSFTISTATYAFDTDNVQPGMILKCYRASTLVEWTLVIKTVTADTITFASTGTATFEDDFYIVYQFRAATPDVPMATVGVDGVYIVDTSDIGIVRYDGEWMSKMALHEPGTSSVPWAGAGVVHWHNGRLLVGRTGETEGSKRLRWSSVIDITEFDPIDFVDFVESSGMILAITELESQPVIFMQDQVYTGVPVVAPSAYGLTFAVPWVFRKLETASSSVIGPFAYASYLNSIIFLGNHDVYTIEAGKKTEKGEFLVSAMQCPVRSMLCTEDDSQRTAQVVFDPGTKSMIFTYCSEPWAIVMLYYFSLETGQWSTGPMLGGIASIHPTMFTERQTWDTMTTGGYTYDDADPIAARSWGYFLSGFASKRLFLSTANGYTKVFDYATPTTEFLCLVTTGFMDFDLPDDEKALYKVAVRIRDDSSTGTRVLRCSVYAKRSVDETSRLLGMLDFTNRREDEIHTRFSGTQIQLNIVFDYFAERFIIEEITLSVKRPTNQVIRGT